MATAAGVFFAAFTIIFWGLDVHYHSYLKIAAATAQRIERELGLSSEVDKVRFGVTSELEQIRKKRRWLPRFFHFIYLVPMFLLIVAMSYFDRTALANSGPEGTILAFTWMAVIFAFIAFWFVSDWEVEETISGKSAFNNLDPAMRNRSVFRWLTLCFVTMLLLWAFFVADLAVLGISGNQLDSAVEIAFGLLLVVILMLILGWARSRSSRKSVKKDLP